jgi:hypothetical protein
MVVALVVGMLLVTASSPEALAKPVTDGFNPVVNNTAPTIGELAVNMVYLPLMMKNFPFVPGAPVLNAISNTDGDGNYTVDWSSSDGADMYILQEDDNAVFSSPTAVYSGSNTSTAISGRNVGMYYYRSQASNTYASSGWSNIEPVTVTVPPPPCPQAGNWLGSTNYHYPISFTVESSPQCRMPADPLTITILDSCGYTTLTYFHAEIPITDGHFDADTGWVRVTGDFTSPTTASGTFSMDRPYPGIPSIRCTKSGTWTASPYP